MNDELIELARRAVASPHWRWLPGMLEVGGMRAVGEEGRGGIFWVDYCSGCYVSTAGRLPDLDDAATLGCLLALVREAWGCPVWLSLDADPEPLDGDETVVCGSERWTACRVGWGLGAQPCGSGPIGAAALVAALEAAPTGGEVNDDLIDLARRAVASPHFRPLRGMVGLDGTVILSTSPLVETSEIVEWRDGGTMRRENRECTWSDLRDGGWLPDLREPATLGCVLVLVREAWGRPLLYVEPEEDEHDGLAWYVWCASEAQSFSSGLHRTEDAALVAALEAAPTPEEK